MRAYSPLNRNKGYKNVNGCLILRKHNDIKTNNIQRRLFLGVIKYLQEVSVLRFYRKNIS